MSKRLVFGLITLVTILSMKAQNVQDLSPGFPDRSADLDVLPGFINPPKGYGEVSFYWWVGDTLTKERITSQLNQLQERSITGLQINYCHSDKGGATYGLTYPSQPALFSEQWWELFQWFLEEAKKRDMTVSLSDYTLGAAGQGWFVDEMLNEYPELHGSRLESKQWEVKGSQQFNTAVPEDIISAKAYQTVNGKTVDDSGVSLVGAIDNAGLSWKVPSGEWKIIVVYRNTVKTSFDPMSPLSGPKVVEKFFQRFEDHCPGEAGKGLNFFFSDELQFGIRGFLWNDSFASEFNVRKGYDIVSELPHLFTNLSPRSYKIRLDYYDVMVSLSEEGFFKPLYDWHNSRGMLFGCDHGGRGRDVTEFGDYFRTQRWMSGPGNDQPGLGRDIIKNKVASSIAHLYERPRTWLEGFYGSGWGTSSQEVADATFANFAMGHNLLSLHGLYYSTHGSWWEWAAPDNHFRQPYWEHMGSFLKCSERLSYLLSQGHHRCDVAMIYPVAPTQARLYGKESTETAFAIARDLYPSGMDFDFMDFESLNRSQIKDKELRVSGEKYKVLILPALSAVRYSTIKKALEFFRLGGIVLAIGDLPRVSDRIGGDDEQLQEMILEMFGTTFMDYHDKSVVYSQKSQQGGLGIFIQNPFEVKQVISGLIQPDFKVLSGDLESNIMHRKLGDRELYFVYGLPKGTECFFRSTGKVELWNPWDGTTKQVKVSSISEDGTTIRLPLELSEPQLIVFSPGKPGTENETSTIKGNSDTLIVDDNWEFEIKPTLDNKFGDYRQPAFDGKLGVELWKMKFAEEITPDPGWQIPTFNDSHWQTAEVSYGTQFWRLGPLPDAADYSSLDLKLSTLQHINPDEPVEINDKKYFWHPHEFSWRFGLKDDVGHQGYHGLKGKVNNELVSFGNIDKSRTYMPVYSLHAEPAGTVYYLWSTVVSPQRQWVEIEKDGLLPVITWVNHIELESGKSDVELLTGTNPILLKYNGTGRGYFVFKQNLSGNPWEKPVSLATDWFLNPAILPFDCRPQEKVHHGWYRFVAPPGARKMFVQSVAKPEIWISGISMACQSTRTEPGRMVDENKPVWEIVFPDSLTNAKTVTLRLEQLPGLYGGAAISEPVIFQCGKGKISLGDLGENESLKTYSGGMWYSKTIQINAEQADSKKILLDLGRVVASAEVFVNEQAAGVNVSSPWEFDLSGMMKTGNNRIEILVYNTLGNHYLNTPSQYIGRTNSGLMGPVLLMFE